MFNKAGGSYISRCRPTILLTNRKDAKGDAAEVLLWSGPFSVWALAKSGRNWRVTAGWQPNGG
jgi:hypothetical protein